MLMQRVPVDLTSDKFNDSQLNAKFPRPTTILLCIEQEERYQCNCVTNTQIRMQLIFLRVSSCPLQT